MENLINTLLTDENGISEEAYNALVDFLESVDHNRANCEELGYYASEFLAMVKRADATDGRFYFPSERD